MPESKQFTLANFEAPHEYVAMVLLVDDQIIIAEAIRRILVDQPNIDFHYCADAHEAVAFAERIKPTVILQDLVLPGVDGLALLRQYRVNPLTRDIPVIVLSTKEEPKVKSEAFKAGANDYLVKLPDPIELVARIRHHSRAYLNQIQRDEAYRVLRESQQQLLEMNLELQRLSSVDGLTGLANRRYFEECLASEWSRAMRGQYALSVLMIDVDDFKSYNDTYGHLAGDEVLKNAGLAIKRSFERTADLPARFGGEEFIVLLPNTDLAGAQYLGEKVRRSIYDLSIPHSASATAAYITVSVGVASSIPQRDQPLSTALVEGADLALYDAKKSGRNRVITFNSVKCDPE
ncbi:MAG: diguanylate cyclase [Pseudomonadota bacterium]